MLWFLLALHVVGIGCAAVAGRPSIRLGLGVAAIPPAATAIWAASLLITNPTPSVHELMWVSGLDLGFQFRLDALALLMTILVSGIGTLVFLYAIGYFAPTATGGSRFPASLLAFSTSMLGLVWADSIWTLFIFWELTSVTSFLLVGHKNVDPTVQAAARRALIITGGGGLVLLAGLLVLADQTGTTALTGLTPVSGSAATLAAVLILIGAATKSAQFPFHVWLPGAMAAPTPVSAYLHSATMVKAGVLLIAVVGPAFAGNTTWKLLGLSFGIITMFWGAIGALRHRDAKLILAWGTVSQLGLLVTLLTIGSAKATFAGISVLFAHALFKAALFLVVGEVDIRTGTREIGELGGLSRSMPITCGVAVLAGLSMAGAPPLLGFTAKEAAIEAALGLTGLERVIVATAIIGGSVLTVAYTLRFLIGVFGPPAAGQSNTVVASHRLAMTVPAVLLGAAGLVGFGALGVVNSIVIPASVELNPKADVYQLIRWPGIKTAFLVSVAVLIAGSLIGWAIARLDKPNVPKTVGASVVDRLIDQVLELSPVVTARIQHGSLPVYLAVMAATASLATLPFLTDVSTDHLVLWDTPIQGAIAVVVLGAAFSGAFVGSRLGAALTLGAVGIGVTALFLIHGAPDLALTQLLVETVIVVGFVIGLGHLARRFPPVENTWRTARIAISAFGGIAVPVALATAGAQPSGTAPIGALTTSAVNNGGGNNTVNVILTDIRALDTLGEVVVLATVAIGILALASTRNQTDQA